MEKRNSQLERGLSVKQTMVLFCTCDSGVARCQNHNTSITSCECVRCSKRIAQACKLGSCQSNFM